MSRLRRWAPWAVVVVVAAVALAVGLHPTGGRPSLDAQVQHISSEVRCPVCHGETVAQSQAAPSVQIRDLIRADLQKGQSESRILSSIVTSYGPGILEKPQASGAGVLVWVLPVIGVVLAAAGLALALMRWRRPVAAGPVAAGPVAAGPVPAGPPRPAPTALDGRAGEAAAAPPATAPAGRGRPGRRSRLVLGCAGVVLVAGGASWAVAASSGTRLPGQEITGQAVGAEEVAAHLQAAHTDEGRSDFVGAVREYQKVLAAQPTQVEALSGEGWLLAETGQPSLLKQGLVLLGRAETAQPDYGPAHLYRGLALLGEADYAESVPELEWYLAHSPDPKLVAQVQKALAQARAGPPAG